MSTIGRRVRELRERRGWKQVDLARESGMSRQWVSSLERGEIDSPGESSVEELAKVFGVSQHFLMHGTNDEAVPVPLDPEVAPIVGRMRRYALWEWKRIEAMAGLAFSQPEPGSEHYVRDVPPVDTGPENPPQDERKAQSGDDTPA